MLRSFNLKSMLFWRVRNIAFQRALSICSDSRAALLALKLYAVSSIVVLQCRDLLALSNRVRLVWVPEHCGMGMRRPTCLQEPNQVLLLWGQRFVFRLHLRVSNGESGSGYLNHTAPHEAWKLHVISRECS
jgi:hypothetical protein